MPKIPHPKPIQKTEQAYALIRCDISVIVLFPAFASQQTKTGNSQVSFSTEGNISSMKPTSIAEAAKQRELGGTLHEPDSKNKKQASNAKTKELSGTDIFGPAPEILPRPSAAARILELKECTEMAEPVRRNARTSMKVSEPDDDSVKKTAKKIHDQKFADLTGNNIFKGDVPPAGSAEKPLSSAKLREMSGSDIFAVGKAEETRDFTRGSRKPPGGVSTIALI
ncbi:hypothetical protein RIF29_42309 [Crotalaria pallida]|uniref:DUF4057 domain-containing protein n=1 Tax=Crotalaria pallida TaxID=3830 RepID=A0AAN9HSF8_CROPI